MKNKILKLLFLLLVCISVAIFHKNNYFVYANEETKYNVKIYVQRMEEGELYDTDLDEMYKTFTEDVVINYTYSLQEVKEKGYFIDEVDLYDIEKIYAKELVSQKIIDITDQSSYTITSDTKIYIFARKHKYITVHLLVDSNELDSSGGAFEKASISDWMNENRYLVTSNYYWDFVTYEVYLDSKATQKYEGDIFPAQDVWIKLDPVPSQFGISYYYTNIGFDEILSNEANPNIVYDDGFSYIPDLGLPLKTSYADVESSFDLYSDIETIIDYNRTIEIIVLACSPSNKVVGIIHTKDVNPDEMIFYIGTDESVEWNISKLSMSFSYIILFVERGYNVSFEINYADEDVKSGEITISDVLFTVGNEVKSFNYAYAKSEVIAKAISFAQAFYGEDEYNNFMQYYSIEKVLVVGDRYNGGALEFKDTVSYNITENTKFRVKLKKNTSTLIFFTNLNDVKIDSMNVPTLTEVELVIPEVDNYVIYGVYNDHEYTEEVNYSNYYVNCSANLYVKYVQIRSELSFKKSDKGFLPLSQVITIYNSYLLEDVTSEILYEDYVGNGSRIGTYHIYFNVKLNNKTFTDSIEIKVYDGLLCNYIYNDIIVIDNKLSYTKEYLVSDLQLIDVLPKQEIYVDIDGEYYDKTTNKPIENVSIGEYDTIVQYRTTDDESSKQMIIKVVSAVNSDLKTDKKESNVSIIELVISSIIIFLLGYVIIKSLIRILR